jgi:PAS domain S-box-containing protein
LTSILSDTAELDTLRRDKAESERRLEAVLNNASVAIFVMNEQRLCTYMNAAAERLTGYAPAEVIGRSLHEVIHHSRPDGTPYPLEQCPIARAFPDSNQKRGEEIFVHKDGSFYPVAFTASPICDERSEIVGTIVEVRDISGERAVREAVAEQGRTLDVLNRTGAAVAAEFDLEKIVQLVTDAGVEITGAQFGAFFYNVVDEAGEGLLLYALSGAPREAFEGFGHPRATAVFGPTFKGEGVVRSDDITQDPRYGRNAPNEGMPEGHLPVRSYLAVSVTSRSGEVIGGLFFGHEKPGVFTPAAERRIVGLAGQAAVAIDNSRLYQAAQREIERRRRAEQELREVNETLEAKVEARTRERDRIFQMSSDLFAVAGFDGYLKTINPAWVELLGYTHEELLARPFIELIHPDDHASAAGIVGSLAGGRRAVNFEDRLVRKDGAPVTVAWTAVPEGDVFYAVGRDVTHDREREEQLRQAQKMEAIGQLTGGIAHDFNNLLTGILGSLELMQRRIRQGRTGELEHYANAATTSANRAAALTQRLLAFSRRQPLDPRPVEANRLVTSMEDLLRRTIGERISLEIVTAGGLWTTRCDPNQLESAILNLAINARDAMPEGGKLTIETCNAHLDDAYVARTREVRPGQYICVCVSDTGMGMTPDVIERAFDPFFTTKPIGQGTGLGLSMIYGFARQSEGYAKIYSEVGQGTTVKLYLPRFLGDAPPTTPRSPSRSTRTARSMARRCWWSRTRPRCATSCWRCWASSATARWRRRTGPPPWPFSTDRSGSTC